MRARIWIFTLVVALALALNLARISLSIAQTGEDTMRARVAAASTALRGQLDLLDARIAPRAVAMMPDLIEAVRGEDRQPPPRPDERALRAAASVLSPEPDLFGVVTAQGAIVSRRAQPAQVLDDPSRLPLAQTASGALPTPTFATFDNAVYRFAAARVPGAAAAVVVGTVVDDRLAAQLKSQVDADVTIVQGGRILASSLPQGEDRTRLLRWAAAPGPGYGVLPIRLPLVGPALSGKLPWGTMRYAVRGALIPLDGGVYAAVTVPASPYLAWLGRYQAFYVLGLSLLVLFGFLWGLLARPPVAVVQQVLAPPPPQPVEPEDGVVSPPRRAPRTPSLIGADVSEPRAEAPPMRDVPWSPGEGPSGEHPVIASAAAAEPLAATPPPAPEPEPSVGGAGEGEGRAATAEPSPPAERATWGALAAEPAGPRPAPEWQMPSLPPDALASGAGSGPRVPEIVDPLVAAPSAPDTALEQAAAGDGSGMAGAPAAGTAAAEPAWQQPPGGEFAPAEALGVAPLSEGVRFSEPPPEASVTMQDFSLPGTEETDPDELHWRETYDRFRELKLQLGEPTDRISFEKFAAKLKKNRADLLARHHCKGVRFSVYEKDGRAAIKASAIR